MAIEAKLSLHCLFCNSSQFALPEEGYQPQSGDLLECANCGKGNDYDSLMRVVKLKATEWAKEQAHELMTDFAKQLRKELK